MYLIILIINYTVLSIDGATDTCFGLGPMFFLGEALIIAALTHFYSKNISRFHNRNVCVF